VNAPEEVLGEDVEVTDLSLVDLIDNLATLYPDARFANYDASYDGGGGSQLNFFQVMRHPEPPNSFLVDWTPWWEPACEWNACMREFKAENAARATNYKYFTGAGTRHTIFGSDKVYTETKSTESDGTPRTSVSWVNSMIADDADWVNVDCNNPGGDCNTLTNSCQGGTNAGDLCQPRCDGGANDGLVCVNGLDCNAVCTGGANDTLPCRGSEDCPDGSCGPACSASESTDCSGGSCALDPDTINAPLALNDTVTCAPTTCPCGEANAACFGGADEGDPCTSDADCTGGTCSFVNCPTFTP
jgi:hypothetical protein